MATLFGMFPFLKTLFADGGYQGPQFAKALAKVLPQLEYSWSVVIQTLRPKESAPASKSSVPIVATLPLHRDAGGIADLDPDRARTGSVGSAVDLLGDDALGAKPASVGENRSAVLRNVFVEHTFRRTTAS